MRDVSLCLCASVISVISVVRNLHHETGKLFQTHSLLGKSNSADQFVTGHEFVVDEEPIMTVFSVDHSSEAFRSLILYILRSRVIQLFPTSNFVFPRQPSEQFL